MKTKLKEEIEKILTIEDALNWNGKGYSESYLSGYQKAYEQVKNDMPKVMKIIKAQQKSYAEEIKKELARLDKVHDIAMELLTDRQLEEYEQKVKKLC